MFIPTIISARHILPGKHCVFLFLFLFTLKIHISGKCCSGTDLLLLSVIAVTVVIISMITLLFVLLLIVLLLYDLGCLNTAAY